jgi:hypothetical protein
LRYSEFVVPIVRAVQEQQKEILDQQQEIAELRALVAEMKDLGSGQSGAGAIRRNLMGMFGAQGLTSTLFGFVLAGLWLKRNRASLG